MNVNPEDLRRKYREGTIITLIEMDCINPLPPAVIGTVSHVDDNGNIHVVWEDGSLRSLDPVLDKFTARRPVQRNKPSKAKKKKKK